MKINRDDTRDMIPLLFKESGFKKGAEIGVFRGEFSSKIIEAMPDINLTCVDMWSSYRRHDHEEVYNSVVERFKDYNVKIMRMKSMDAVKLVEDESLDFIYIDADHHFEGAYQDIVEWSKKVRPGGIISGHDYYTGRNCQVQAAVDKFVSENNIDPWYVTMERKTKSFFWVKK